MPYFLKGTCVWKGTEEKPIEEVKCHTEHAAAVAHMRALYANVEDAAEKAAWDAEIEKGGPGSGWHGPAEGTHTAANAPNFAGGPGADRKYGAEDEPEEGQKHCKCTKCGSTFTLPKGKQCKDVECPGCGGRATQTSPRRDKPAEGEEGGGSSGRSKGQETHECVCSECDKSVHVPLGQKCNEVPCPECKEMMKQATSGSEEDKATAGAPGPTVHGEGSTLGDTASVMDDGSSSGGCKCPKCGKEIPCTAKVCPHCKEKIDHVDRGEDKKAFTSYKSTDGSWRWLSLSSWAVVDKEREVVSEQAYRDAISYAQKSGDWGELDLVHIGDTDVGDCDTLFVLKGEQPAKFGAGGTWYDTAKATRAREAIQAEPEHWGVSIKFRFNPQRLVRGVYTGDIQVLKHSVLPQAMAASYGTAIAVQGGKEMSKQLDEKAAEALRKLGHSEEEIAELAEKSKALPTEENVAEKENATAERATFLDQLKQALGIQVKRDDPEASEPEEAEKTEEAKPVEAKKAETEKPAVEQPDPSALLAALVEPIAKAVGEMVRDELVARDERLAILEVQIKAVGESVEEKVEQRLSDVPPVVKVAASQVAATAVQEEPKGLTFGQKRADMTRFNDALLTDIKRVVEDKMQGAFQV